jgi:hypothetical protein
MIKAPLAEYAESPLIPQEEFDHATPDSGFAVALSEKVTA